MSAAGRAFLRLTPRCALVPRRSADRRPATCSTSRARRARAAAVLREVLADSPGQAQAARAPSSCAASRRATASPTTSWTAWTAARTRRPSCAGSIRADAARSWRQRSTTSSTTPRQAADQLGLTASRRRWSRRCELAESLVGAARAGRGRAARSLRTGHRPRRRRLVEIHRLENEGDRVSRDAVAWLFEAGIDPMVVIRWKDIHAALEAARGLLPRSVAHHLARASGAPGMPARRPSRGCSDGSRRARG